MQEANTIAPPGQEFAHNLVKKYLAAAPINFKVHPAPPVIDFTATVGDGETILNEKKQPRRPQLLDLQSDALNTVMIEAAQKKIGFLGTVKS